MLKLIAMALYYTGVGLFIITMVSLVGGCMFWALSDPVGQLLLGGFMFAILWMWAGSYLNKL